VTEVVEGVHRIEAEVAGRPLYLFLFLGERRLLLDAGCSTTVAEFVAPYLYGLGLGLDDLDLLVVTHSDLDHQGGVHAVARENPRLIVACGVLDRELVSDPDVLVARRYSAYREHGIEYGEEALAWIREMSGAAQAVDLGLAGGETIRLGPGFELSVLHVPGHSPGHLALYDGRSRALFSGDCVQGSVYLGLDGAPKLCPTYTDVDPYLETVTAIESLAPSELHGCHWPAKRGNEVDGFLAETRDYVSQLDGLARECLKAGDGLTLRELIERCNERLPEPWDAGTAHELAFSLHGHVQRLVERGLADVDRDGPSPVYRWAA
jgi:glyoxylase-like metal-dependent hydrolase (beta-lactamase superfamily II)